MRGPCADRTSDRGRFWVENARSTRPKRWRSKRDPAQAEEPETSGTRLGGRRARSGEHHAVRTFDRGPVFGGKCAKRRQKCSRSEQGPTEAVGPEPGWRVRRMSRGGNAPSEGDVSVDGSLRGRIRHESDKSQTSASKREDLRSALIRAIMPPLGLENALRHWNDIAGGRAEEPRARQRRRSLLG